MINDDSIILYKFAMQFYSESWFLFFFFLYRSTVIGHGKII